MSQGVEVIDICSSSDDENANDQTENNNNNDQTEDSKDSKALVLSRRRRKIDELLDNCILNHNRCVAVKSLMNPMQHERWSSHLASINPTYQPQTSSYRPNFNNTDNRSDQEAPEFDVRPADPIQRRRAFPRRRIKKAKRKSPAKVGRSSTVSPMAKCKAAANKIAKARSTNVKKESRVSAPKVKAEPKANASRVKKER